MSTVSGGDKGQFAGTGGDLQTGAGHVPRPVGDGEHPQGGTLIRGRGRRHGGDKGKQAQGPGQQGYNMLARHLKPPLKNFPTPQRGLFTMIDEKRAVFVAGFRKNFLRICIQPLQPVGQGQGLV